jgi:2',3'-cyclic-nucleotide 2'-phosphodiesterase (5'-nucleotidase family)
VLTIGNHELYVSEIAYETFGQFAKIYGDRYVTSNVKILNPTTGKFEYVGVPYRYFTTAQGLRIMAFGVIFDFAGNSNVSQVTKTSTLVTQQWFLDAINYTKPIDMYIVAGHNPIRTNASTSTFGAIYKAIRNINKHTPIQFFGGHTHIRDFFVYDNVSTGIESGMSSSQSIRERARRTE